MINRQQLRSIALLTVVLTIVNSKGVSAADERPIALHPENPHYFVWRNQPTVLVTSGEHYGALLNLDFDYERYFDELRSFDLNHTRTFSGTYRELSSSFGISDNPLAPRPNRYVAPWARSNQAGYSDGGSKFDLTTWEDAYFKRLRDFMLSTTIWTTPSHPDIPTEVSPATVHRAEVAGRCVVSCRS